MATRRPGRDRVPGPTVPVYVISVAAELTGLHPQTLRQYDRAGLVSPGRTGGGGRRYSLRDIELLREVADLTAAGIGLEVHDTGSLRGDLLATFCGPRGPVGPDATALMGAVVTALGSDPEFAALFRAQVIAPKVAVADEIYRRATRRGEISADLDLDVIVPALAGIVLHRFFVLGLTTDDDSVRRVVDHVILPAVGLRAPASTPIGTPAESVRA